MSEAIKFHIYEYLMKSQTRQEQWKHSHNRISNSKENRHSSPVSSAQVTEIVGTTRSNSLPRRFICKFVSYEEYAKKFVQESLIANGVIFIYNLLEEEQIHWKSYKTLHKIPYNDAW